MENVTDEQLQNAGVTKSELKRIKEFLEIDIHMFNLPDNIKENPYDDLVDLSKYDMTKVKPHLKEILYRPAQVKHLYNQYWKIAGEQEKKQFEVIDEKKRVGWDPRYPPKKESENEIFRKVVKHIK